jgi:hypothetical protein
MQSLEVAEIRQSQIQAPLVVVVRNVVLREEPPLRERAIPLRGGRLDVVGEIQAGHDLATLPTAVGRTIGPPKQIGTMRDMSDPCATAGTPIDR